MSQYLFALVLVMLFFSACTPKSLPLSSRKPVKTVSVTPPGAMVIIDGQGNLLVKENQLPAGASRSILDLQNARAFTPEQTKRLVYRFHTIPPKVLYVPGSLVSNTPKGSYYIYHKKFWYWEKKDGYFYLDENYFK